VLARAGLQRGEALAHALAEDEGEGTWLLGTRDALVLVSPEGSSSIPWERIETADWDRDQERLRVVEVAGFGERQPVHSLTVTDPGQLLAMVRERVTASVLLQRRVVVSGRRGLSVIARRAPHGRGPVTWAWEYDAGVDPDDPVVRSAAEAGLRAAQDDLGGTEEPI
jgi:hypothetical protein